MKNHALLGAALQTTSCLSRGCNDASTDFSYAPRKDNTILGLGAVRRVIVALAYSYILDKRQALFGKPFSFMLKPALH